MVRAANTALVAVFIHQPWTWVGSIHGLVWVGLGRVGFCRISSVYGGLAWIIVRDLSTWYFKLHDLLDHQLISTAIAFNDKWPVKSTSVMYGVICLFKCNQNVHITRIASFPLWKICTHVTFKFVAESVQRLDWVATVDVGWVRVHQILGRIGSGWVRENGPRSSLV